MIANIFARRACLPALLGTAIALAALPAAAQRSAEVIATPIPPQLIGDSDGDGVIDFDDACPNQPGVSYAQARAEGLLVNVVGCPAGTADVRFSAPAAPSYAAPATLATAYGARTYASRGGRVQLVGSTGAVDTTSMARSMRGDVMPNNAAPVQPASSGAAGTFIPGPELDAQTANSCTIDSDGDGTPNCYDACLGTSRGTPTNASGCPTAAGQPQAFVAPGSMMSAPGAAEPAAQALVSENATTQPAYGVTEVKIQFAPDSSALSPSDNAEIDRLLGLMQQYPRLVIVLEGHTDNTGPLRANTQLATRRAVAVREALLARGADPQRVYAVGYGEVYPAASNATAQGRAKNRRTVGLLFY